MKMMGFIGMCILILISGCNSEPQCWKSPIEPGYIDDTLLNILQNHFNLSDGEEIKFDCNIESPNKNPPEEVGDVYTIECQDLKFYCKLLNISYGIDDVVCGSFTYRPTYLGLGDCYE